MAKPPTLNLKRFPPRTAITLVLVFAGLAMVFAGAAMLGPVAVAIALVVVGALLAGVGLFAVDVAPRRRR